MAASPYKKVYHKDVFSVLKKLQVFCFSYYAKDGPR